MINNQIRFLIGATMVLFSIKLGLVIFKSLEMAVITSILYSTFLFGMLLCLRGFENGRK